MRSKGFTVVELLIVIIVIGILAALVLSSFTNARRDARNTQRVTAAKEWQKIITMYTSGESKYSVGASNNHICLGTGYPTDMDAGAGEDCAWSNNIKHPNATANADYSKYASSLPTFPPDRLPLGSSNYAVGISMRSYDSVNGVLLYPILLYHLEGTDQDCGLRPVVTPIGGAGTTSAGAKNSGNDGPSTVCRIALPNPNEL